MSREDLHEAVEHPGAVQTCVGSRCTASCHNEATVDSQRGGTTLLSTNSDEVCSQQVRENAYERQRSSEPGADPRQGQHPIVDGDGHWVEFPPVFAEKMRKVGGDKAADGFLAPRGASEPLKMTPAERTERRIAQPNFWTAKAKTRSTARRR